MLFRSKKKKVFGVKIIHKLQCSYVNIFFFTFSVCEWPHIYSHILTIAFLIFKLYSFTRKKTFANIRFPFFSHLPPYHDTRHLVLPLFSPPSPTFTTSPLLYPSLSALALNAPEPLHLLFPSSSSFSLLFFCLFLLLLLLFFLLHSSSPPPPSYPLTASPFPNYTIMSYTIPPLQLAVNENSHIKKPKQFRTNNNFVLQQMYLAHNPSLLFSPSL